MMQDFARDAARIITCKFGVPCTFFCKILQELVQDCARIVQEKGHIACTCQASLACKILAQSCMILQVRFCWDICMTPTMILYPQFHSTKYNYEQANKISTTKDMPELYWTNYSCIGSSYLACEVFVLTSSFPPS